MDLQQSHPSSLLPSSGNGEVLQHAFGNPGGPLLLKSKVKIPEITTEQIVGGDNSEFGYLSLQLFQAIRQ